jgi:hypothetical protein
MSATSRNLETLARALANGYSIGPRSSCAACNAKLEDFDCKCRGLCETCSSAVDALKPAQRSR